MSGKLTTKNLEVGENITMSGSGNKFDMSGCDLDVSGVTIRKDLTVNGNIYYNNTNNINNLLSTIIDLQDNITNLGTSFSDADTQTNTLGAEIEQIKEKTDKITITSDVNLDSMNNTITPSQISAITANTAKKTYPSSASTKLALIGITSSVDLNSMNNTINSMKIDIIRLQGGYTQQDILDKGAVYTSFFFQSHNSFGSNFVDTSWGTGTHGASILAMNGHHIYTYDYWGGSAKGKYVGYVYSVTQPGPAGGSRLYISGGDGNGGYDEAFYGNSIWGRAIFKGPNGP